MTKNAILFRGLLDIHAQVCALIDLAAATAEVDPESLRALSLQIGGTLEKHDAVDAPMQVRQVALDLVLPVEDEQPLVADLVDADAQAARSTLEDMTQTE